MMTRKSGRRGVFFAGSLLLAVVACGNDGDGQSAGAGEGGETGDGGSKEDGSGAGADAATDVGGGADGADADVVCELPEPVAPGSWDPWACEPSCCDTFILEPTGGIDEFCARDPAYWSLALPFHTCREGSACTCNEWEECFVARKELLDAEQSGIAPPGICSPLGLFDDAHSLVAYDESTCRFEPAPVPPWLDDLSMVPYLVPSRRTPGLVCAPANRVGFNPHLPGDTPFPEQFAMEGILWCSQDWGETWELVLQNATPIALVAAHSPNVDFLATTVDFERTQKLRRDGCKWNIEEIAPLRIRGLANTLQASIAGPPSEQLAEWQCGERECTFGSTHLVVHDGAPAHTTLDVDRGFLRTSGEQDWTETHLDTSLAKRGYELSARVKVVPDGSGYSLISKLTSLGTSNPDAGTLIAKLDVDTATWHETKRLCDKGFWVARLDPLRMLCCTLDGCEYRGSDLPAPVAFPYYEAVMGQIVPKEIADAGRGDWIFEMAELGLVALDPHEGRWRPLSGGLMQPTARTYQGVSPRHRTAISPDFSRPPIATPMMYGDPFGSLGPSDPNPSGNCPPLD